MRFYFTVKTGEVKLILLGLAIAIASIIFQLITPSPGFSKKRESNSTDAKSGGLANPIENDPVCGLASETKLWPDEPTYDGVAGFGSFPWQVQIGVGQISIDCGGVIINNRHVVTAASCVANAVSHGVAVRVGDYRLHSDDEPPQLKSFYVRPSEIIVHPLYKVSSGRQPDRYNVAVLRLGRKLTYQPHIRPICLPELGANFTGEMGWNSGWGDSRPIHERNHRLSGYESERHKWRILKAVEMPIVDNQHCREWEKRNGHHTHISEEMLCAGMETFGGRQQCQGDRGGPLMLKKDDGRWYLVGVQSDRFSCSYLPGTFHRVSSTSDWISEVANEVDEDDDNDDDEMMTLNRPHPSPSPY